MNKLLQLFVATMMIVIMMGLEACEKAVFNEQQEKKPIEGNVIIRASLYNIVPFETRAVQSVADFSTNLQFVLFQNGAKVKAVTQKRADDNYGEIGLTLNAGTYQLLVLAHSSTGNPSVANPEFIQFTNSMGFSDTFYYYGDIEVTGEQTTYDIRLQRATSMVRVIIQDAIPSEVKTIRLFYTGESGVFNAVTGMGGTVNSQQSIVFDVEGQAAPLTLCAYTFLRDETGSLNMTISARDANNDVKFEKTLANIPMKNHMVTEYSGKLFTEPGNKSDDVEFSLTAETEWEVYQRCEFEE